MLIRRSKRSRAYSVSPTLYQHICLTTSGAVLSEQVSLLPTMPLGNRALLSHSALVEDAKTSSFTLPAEEALRKILRYYNTIRTRIRQCKDETLLEELEDASDQLRSFGQRIRHSQRRIR